MADPPRKPTGQVGYNRASIKGVEFIPIPFPRTKAEIEEFIVHSFIRQAQQSRVLNYEATSVQQNAVDDFDYQLDTSEGQKYMELMEVAPLEHLRGSYDSAPSSYNEYDFAEYILKKALSKSAKYKGSTDKPITLLTYITHWAFLPSTTVQALLQYWLLQHPHCFEHVYLYCPIEPTEGTASILFPTPREFWTGVDPEAYRQNRAYLLSPTKWLFETQSASPDDKTGNEPPAHGSDDSGRMKGK